MYKILESVTMHCIEGMPGEKGSKSKQYTATIAQIGPGLWSVDGKSGKIGGTQVDRPHKNNPFTDKDEAFESYEEVINTRKKHGYK